MRLGLHLWITALIINLVLQYAGMNYCCVEGIFGRVKMDVKE